MSVQYIKLSQMHLRTTELFSAVTHARMKSHNNSDMECFTILYKITAQWVKLSPTHFWEPSSLFSTVTCARSKSHTTPDTEWVRILHWVLAALRWTPFLEMGSFPRKLRGYPFKAPGTSKRSFCFSLNRLPAPSQIVQISLQDHQDQKKKHFTNV